MAGKTLIAVVVSLTVILVAASYYFLIHLPEQAKKPFKQAGLTDEQANEFVSRYKEQNGNSTWVSFAQAWAKDQALAEKSFDVFKDLKSSLGYIYFVNSNGYDGLSFLADFPQLKDNYREIMPAYSSNSSLVRIVFDQFQRDGRISDRNALFLEALKAYQELNLLNKNLLLPTVHSVNNLTIAYKQEGLPRFDKNTVWLLTNATQISNYGSKLVDFEPIVFKSVDGNVFYIIPNSARVCIKAFLG
ncbi:MAG: hypothetical protein ACPLZ8_07385 [Fervidicoccaceae archaeon]